MLIKDDVTVDFLYLPFPPPSPLDGPQGLVMLHAACPHLCLLRASPAPAATLPHLWPGHHFLQRRLLRAVRAPGGAQPARRLLRVPGGVRHLGHGRDGHRGPRALWLALGPWANAPGAHAEPVDAAPGPVPADAAHWHHGRLHRPAGGQPGTGDVLRRHDATGVRRGARDRGDGTHAGRTGAAAAYRECRRASGRPIVR